VRTECRQAFGSATHVLASFKVKKNFEGNIFFRVWTSENWTCVNWISRSRILILLAPHGDGESTLYVQARAGFVRQKRWKKGSIYVPSLFNKTFPLYLSNEPAQVSPPPKFCRGFTRLLLRPFYCLKDGYAQKRFAFKFSRNLDPGKI
jgi:hypothetical protein